MNSKDIVNNNLIDCLIEEIMGNNRYEDLTYWNKTSVCKLVIKKVNLFGKATC